MTDQEAMTSRSIESSPGAGGVARIDRRRLLAVGGVGAAGLVGLAACGDAGGAASEDPLYGGGAGGGAAKTTASSGTSEGTTASPSSPSATAQAPAGPGLIALSAVPVGGAAAAKGPDGKPIVVAQPTAGTVVAYSAVCPHQGCTVAPAQDRLRCPCHASVFSLDSGEHLSGPAPRGLDAIAVKVVDGQVVPA